VTIVQLSDTLLQAKVTFAAEMQSIFGVAFNALQYPISMETDATMSTAPYLEVQILLDNSSSMQIGATPSDILAIENLTACLPSSADPYSTYECTGTSGPQWGGGTLTFSGTCPVSVTVPGFSVSAFPVASTGPSCQKVSGGRSGTATAPCGFACHFDTSKPAGLGSDSYGTIRKYAGTANQITLRTDVVKAAVNTVISTLGNENNGSLNNLSVGIWHFDQNLYEDYPGNGAEAGNDWTAATNAVGAAPTSASNPADTGIQAAVANPQHQNTNFNGAATQLSTKISAGGKGTSPAAPRKVLFIVTDGLEDEQGSAYTSIGALSTTPCETFKSMGYTIYVVYTPYNAMPSSYFFYSAPAVQPINNSPVTAALQACSSDPVNDYIAASDQSALTAALLTFLKSALAAPAMFTK
jgi:hypothetical protein